METSYVVLRDSNPPLDSGQSGSPSGYKMVSKFTAGSAEAAVRAAAEKEGAGTYIAIPARSFKPVVVKVETKKVVSVA